MDRDLGFGDSFPLNLNDHRAVLGMLDELIESLTREATNIALIYVFQSLVQQGNRC
jgi:hypothetical protein